jgi:hypothetical protein
MIMALIFRKEDEARISKADDAFSQHGKMRKGPRFFTDHVALLLSGTLKLDFSPILIPLSRFPFGIGYVAGDLYRLIPLIRRKERKG